MDEHSAGDGGPRRRAHPPGTWRVGTIGGVDVLVRSSWLLVAALIAVLLAPRIEQVQPGLGALRYVAGIAFAVLLYLSVLLHEISHALVAQRFGLGVRSISLHFLGGATEIESETRTALQEFTVAVVGPLTSLLVGGVALACVRSRPRDWCRSRSSCSPGPTWSSAVLNLVPGLPLDGGRVLKEAVWGLTGDVNARHHRRGLGRSRRGRARAAVAPGLAGAARPAARRARTTSWSW